MRTMLLLTALATLAPGVVAQGGDTTAALPSVSLPAELDRVLRDYERAWKAGDAAALAGLFTTDGFVPGRAGWRRGSADIRANYANAGGDLKLRAHAWATADTVGYIIGAYGYGSEANTPDRGKFVLALRRSGNRWLIAADLDSTNRP